jgi:hypothetical protein
MPEEHQKIVDEVNFIFYIFRLGYLIRLGHNKLVGFAHPAMAGLEYWNDGIMGSGKMGLWDIDNTPLDKEVKSIQ